MAYKNSPHSTSLTTPTATATTTAISHSQHSISSGGSGHASQHLQQQPPHSPLFADSELESNWQQIKENAGDIIWREWFFTKVDKILDMQHNPTSSSTTTSGVGTNSSPHCPTLKNVTVIFGHAGSGKTFLLQLLMQAKCFSNRILLPFFCKYTSTQPMDFLADFEHRIEEVFATRQSAPRTVAANVHFREHLLRRLNQLTSDQSAVAKYQLSTKRYLLLIDSIDLRPDICELVSTNVHAFPSWLHVIITARPKRYRGITKMFSGARKIVLDDIKKSNVYNDIMDYLVANKHQIVSDPVAMQHLSKTLLNKIVAKSNGSVLYVRILLDCLERAIFNTTQLDFVGATLNGLYLAIFTNLFNNNPQFEADYKAVLSMIDRINCFQISIAELKSKLNLEDDALSRIVEQLFAHCLIVFSEDHSHIRLIHSSLFEWLSDIKHCSARFICHSYNPDTPTATPVATISAAQQQQSSTDTSVAKTTNLSAATSTRHHQIAHINNRFINDANDDSINDISDEMLFEKLADSDQGLAQQQQPSMIEERLSKHHNRAAYKNPSNVDLDNSFNASSSGGGHLYLDHHALQHHYHSTESSSLLKIKHASFAAAVDEELVDSEGEEVQLFEEKQQDQLSKEYLAKLHQKFESALHLSDVKTLRNILSRYAPIIIDQSFLDNKTPLYWAIKKSNVKLVELFIEFGADVNAVCDAQWGYTPLIVALMQHSYDMCELLLENDADVEQLDRYSMPPILHAILVNCSPEIIKLLLYWGAHTDFIDEAGRSLLHFAANESKTWSETISLLLTVGCDEMHRDNDGQTALHMAAANGSLDTVEVLIEFGGDKLVHTADKAGQLPLHVAVAKNNFEVCDPLITPKSINMLAHNGNSPLRIAILYYYLDLAQLLILKGADINYQDADGRSITYCVVAFTHSTLEQQGPPFFNVSTLYKNGPEEYLDTAVKAIGFLVRFGVDLEIKDIEGRTALHVAAWQGNYLIVETLIRLGADINAVDNEGRTSLHMCAWNGYLEVVRLLVESGASVNHVSTTQGATPLLVAAQQGHIQTCAYLLQVGSAATVIHRDLYGRDARAVAVNCGHHSIVTLIDNFLSESVTNTTTATLTNNTNPSNDSIGLENFDQFAAPLGITNSNGGGGGGTSASTSASTKLSKYDPRFYGNSNVNSVPNKKSSGSGNSNNKKNKSISKLSKILH